MLWIQFRFLLGLWLFTQSKWVMCLMTVYLCVYEFFVRKSKWQEDSDLKWCRVWVVLWFVSGHSRPESFIRVSTWRLFFYTSLINFYIISPWKFSRRQFYFSVIKLNFTEENILRNLSLKKIKLKKIKTEKILTNIIFLLSFIQENKLTVEKNLT